MSDAQKNAKDQHRSTAPPPSHTAPVSAALTDEREDAIAFALTAFADPTRSYDEQKEALNAMFTRTYLKKLMAAANGNQSVAARTAGLDRTYLGRLLLKYGMRS
ncbi:MAG: hypothetical protein ABI461_11835 [Polyangiaceae bacterium]